MEKFTEETLMIKHFPQTANFTCTQKKGDLQYHLCNIISQKFGLHNVTQHYFDQLWCYMRT